jgi:outer membrane protein assembly factor BamB
MRSHLRIFIPIFLSLTLICVAGFTLLGRTQKHAHAAGPSIALYNNFGRPYAAFTVSGMGFGQNEAVTITFDAKTIGTTTAVQTKFAAKVDVPGSATPGNHTVTATGSHGSTASATFLVQTWWVMFGFDAQNTHNNPDENVIGTTNVSNLTVQWAHVGTGISTPAIRKDEIFYTTHGGTVNVLHPGGTVRWSKSINSTFSSSAVAVYYGIVYVGADDGNMYGFNYNTGALMWTFPTGGPILGSAIIAASAAYFGSSDDNLYALQAGDNVTTGTLKWKYTTGGPISSTPALGPGGNVYVTSQDGNLYALSNKGALLWKVPTGGSITSSPTVANGLVYFGSSNGTFYAVNATTGQQTWSYTTNGPITSSSSVDKNNVYIGSQDGNLYALNPMTGTFSWKATTAGAINSSPASANGVVYVGSEDNSIYAFNAKTGAKLWSYATTGKIEGSPVVSDGIVFISSTDGHLYSFK